MAPSAAAALTPAQRQLLLAQPWLRTAQPALQHFLLEQGRRQYLAAGEALFQRGGAAHGLGCVLAGALHVGAWQADGRQSLLAYLEPGQWFGEISLIDDRPRTHDVVADGASEVWLVPQPLLRDWLERHPQGWRDIARLACAKLRICFEALEDNALLPLPRRLAKRLLQVAQGYEPGAPDEVLPRQRLRLPQEQLALMLGVSRPTINKALRALAEQGLIALGYAEIELRDAEGLRRLALDDGAPGAEGWA
ncbi:Crp/Fnr family transcriptional regulator [Pelomonas sp. CA6]|uniref:Crp/Fnr family transcriptional regulator n=1 Tax=Pelomonas sp. CA6 TaxID=2907999 RepID=UPI001F4A8DF1|nr:Crp/Fnr family transcriptional regulator [Pelomonas sp. CA6]MCH7342427.1 Crp/Fnr family transcriptional regulator [Pelomonas sp. CA6]